MNVIRHILRNRILIILLLIIVWSVISESPFQKGGVRANMHYIIYFINVVLSFVYILPFLKNKISYKIGVIISFIFSFIGLLIGLLSTEYILEIIYGSDYDINSNKIIANLIFYFSSNLFSMIFSSFIFKKAITNKDNQVENN